MKRVTMNRRFLLWSLSGALLALTAAGASLLGADAPKYPQSAYEGAFLSHVTPQLLAPGGEFTIRGEGFGEAAGSVTLAGLECEVVTWADHTIHARAPAEAATGPVEVKTGGKTLTTKLDLQVNGPSAYVPPHIEAMEVIRQGHEEKEVYPGDQLVLTGTGFCSAQGGAYLTYNFKGGHPTPASDGFEPTIDSWSDSEVRVTIPEMCEQWLRPTLLVGDFVLLSPDRIPCKH